MLMLHISDIHFKSPECLDPFLDPDFAIRAIMMQDLAQQVSELGNIGAILVGGDIAYKAAQDEYDSALNWLQQLAAISGCPKERIFVVPGNHDVDRGYIKKHVSTQAAQHHIASASRDNRERRLRQQLADDAGGQSLLAPHAEYNVFAARFGCQIWPAKPFWHQDLALEGGVTLRIYGLTSTLLSGQNGEDDAQGGLYLSPLQTALIPTPNTVNLVLVHHPTDWLDDRDAVEDDLTSRARFHLFGHKHRQRAILGQYVRVGAAAVNPSRNEHPYDPGYNLIRLEVAGQDNDRKVLVELRQRHLQDNPECFVPRLDLDRNGISKAVIPIPLVPNFPAVSGATALPAQSRNAAEGRIALPDAEAAMGETDTRDLLYRFWALTSSQRRSIAQELRLLEEGEMKLPEPERYGRALIRAGQRNLINEVAAAVARLES